MYLFSMYLGFKVPTKEPLQCPSVYDLGTWTMEPQGVG